MSTDKHAVVLHQCLLVLGSKLEGFFALLCDLQLSHALAVLTSAPKQDEFLAKHNKVWEELIHPFKLLCECEKHYYEWGFLPPIPVYDASTLLQPPAPASGKKAPGSEDHVKYMYSQIPLGLRKSMAALQKAMPQNGVHLALRAASDANAAKQLASASSANLQLQLQQTQGMSQEAMHAQFASIFHVMDELIHGMLKITMIQIYQNMNGPWAVASRVKELNWAELVRVCEKLRLKCEKAFTHPFLLTVKNRLLLPELFLLEQVCALECENTMLPRFDWQHCMFLLMRIRAEHTRWMTRLLARDKDGRPTQPGMSSSLNASLAALRSRKPATGAGEGKHSALVVPATTSLVFPAVLHWTHAMHHSLLSKSTLIFWQILSRKSAEIKGDDMAAKLERLDVNYVSLIDKLVKRLPHCYSFSVLLDCTNMPQPVDPLAPMHLTDSAAPADGTAGGGTADDAARPSGGLANYPLLFHWPANKPMLEKWNVISILLSKQELMNSLAATQAPSKGGSSPAPPGVPPPHVPRQTNTYCLSIGPSNHVSDLLMWDYESEWSSYQQCGVPAANSVSYFLCKVDHPGKGAWIVITFQSNVPDAGTGGNGEAVLAPGSVSRESTGSDSTAAANSLTLPTSVPLLSTPTHSSGGGSGSTNGTPSSIPLTAAARKRAFDAILQEVTPLLFKLRHGHVFQQLVPKKKA